MEEHVRAITWENAGKLAGFYQRGTKPSMFQIYIKRYTDNKKTVLTWL